MRIGTRSSKKDSISGSISGAGDKVWSEQKQFTMLNGRTQTGHMHEIEFTR